MRLNVNLKFNSEEREHIINFAEQVGMSVDDFCKRAVFFSINHAYKLADQEQKETQNAAPSNDTGTVENGDASVAASSLALTQSSTSNAE